MKSYQTSEGEEEKEGKEGKEEKEGKDKKCRPFYQQDDVDLSMESFIKYRRQYDELRDR